jgi:hypothetical protein
MQSSSGAAESVSSDPTAEGHDRSLCSSAYEERTGGEVGGSGTSELDVAVVGAGYGGASRAARSVQLTTRLWLDVACDLLA